MRDRSPANGALLGLSALLWLGFIFPGLQMLQCGILTEKAGYLYYTTSFAAGYIVAAVGAAIVAIVAARAAGRCGAGERGKAVTVGLLGVLAVQIIITVMIPAGYFLGARLY